MSIDWSKAPEGATHFDPVDQNWLMQFLNISFCWLASEGWTTKGWQYPNDLSTMPRLISRPAWDGAGLPPVGVVCEHRTGHGMAWSKATVLAYGEKKAFYRDRDGHEWTRLYDEIEFRPIRTPEQIADQARTEAIDDMIKALGMDNAGTGEYIRCGLIYDAGFRKKVTP